MRRRNGIYYYLSEEEVQTGWESCPSGHIWFKAFHAVDGWVLYGDSDVYARDRPVRRFRLLREAIEWLRANYELAKRIAWPRIFGDC
jgi:hypothetical protein